jgi:hypothetical protein
LSESDIAELRREVEAGKRPRVFATAASGLGAGTSGQVIAVRDPAEREFVVVRIGGDELPFAPEDLSRTRAGAVEGRPRPASRRAPTPRVDRGHAAPPPASTRSPDAPAPAPATPVKAAAQPRPQRAKRGQRAQASLAVTVRYADGRWTVEAARGARTVVKAAPVRAGHALQLIEQLDMPAVTELVADAVAAGRDDAERRARELREQLAAAEAELADYERRPAT